MFYTLHVVLRGICDHCKVSYEVRRYTSTICNFNVQQRQKVKSNSQGFFQICEYVTIFFSFFCYSFVISTLGIGPHLVQMDATNKGEFFGRHTQGYHKHNLDKAKQILEPERLFLFKKMYYLETFLSVLKPKQGRNIIFFLL